MGLTALRRNKAVIDFAKMEMHFCGEADYDLEMALPEGTHTFNLELAPSGHIVVPCSDFKANKDLKQDESTLTLITRELESKIQVPPPLVKEAPKQVSFRSSL